MNVNVENLGPCRKLIRIDVPADVVEQAFKETLQLFRKQVKLPGFRPGKAPTEMVNKAYSQQIANEVKSTLINDHYKKALKEHNITPVIYPEIEEIQFGKGKDLQFAATVETQPEFELPEYKHLPVKRELRTVSEEDVQRALETLQERESKYADVERAIEMDDFAVVNYSGTIEGQPIVELSPDAKGLSESKDFWIHIKKDAFLPGFAEQLIGLTKGGTKEVHVDFPEDFLIEALKGKKAVYQVEIVEVKVKQLPALDDEFARRFGAEDFEVLQQGIEQDLANELKYTQKRNVREQLIRSLLSRAQFDLPESLVGDQTRQVVYDIVKENQKRGVPKEKIEASKDDIYKAANTSARDRVKVSFLVGKIAEKEGIKVKQDEVAHYITGIAHQYNIAPEKMAKKIKERNGLNEIYENIIREKVLDLLELNADVEEILAPSDDLGSVQK